MDYHKLSRSDDIDYQKSGYLLAAILLAGYGLMLYKGRNVPALAVVAAALVLMAVMRSRLLDHVIKQLVNLGNMMHKVTNPVVFGCVYVAAVLPVAVLLKLFKKDILRLNRETSRSYWITRPAMSWKDSFRNQF